MKHINLSPDRLRTLDPQDMLSKTLELPEQIRHGTELGREFLARHHLEPVRELDWFGLGGSAVAGDLLQAFGYEPPQLPLRLRVCRYPRPSSLPRLVSSYSGNTVESVHAFAEVPPAQVWMAMSAGGRLERLAREQRVPFLHLPGGYLPRAAVGFGLGAMMAVLDALYGTTGVSEFEQLYPALATEAERYSVLDIGTNPALSLAARLTDRTAVMYSVDGLSMPAVGARWAAQLAENSKVWSHTAGLPELAHNEVEAFAFLGQLLPPPLVIFLGHWHLTEQFADPRPGLIGLLDGLQIQHITLDPAELWVTESGRLAAALRLMLLLDASSVFLALLRAQDPAEIPLITKLKESSRPA